VAGAFNLSLLVAAIRLTTPILLAALGGLFTQQANVLNIALEGMMLSGAFTAVAVSFFTHSWVMAILASVLVGLIMAWILGAFVVRFKALNVIAGMAVNLFASGFTAFLLRTIWTNKSEMTQGLVGIPDVVIPGLCNVPVLGELLSGYSFLVYISIVLVFVAQFVLYKTKLCVKKLTATAVKAPESIIPSRAILSTLACCVNRPPNAASRIGVVNLMAATRRDKLNAPATGLHLLAARLPAA
jgi:ABC-type uncharacterized transport system permease subunit